MRQAFDRSLPTGLWQDLLAFHLPGQYRGWPGRRRLIIPHKSGRGAGAAVMDEAELTGERRLIGGGELMGCTDEMGVDFARRTRRIGGAVHGVARNRIREESSRVKERRWWDGIGDAGAAVV
jgi:hypothetical protein